MRGRIQSIEVANVLRSIIFINEQWTRPAASAQRTNHAAAKLSATACAREADARLYGPVWGRAARTGKPNSLIRDAWHALQPTECHRNTTVDKCRERIDRTARGCECNGGTSDVDDIHECATISRKPHACVAKHVMPSVAHASSLAPFVG